jgi:AraC-like DNA-binding protein
VNAEKERTLVPRVSLAPGVVPGEELPLLWRRSIAPFFDAQPNTGPESAPRLPEIHQYHLGKSIFADSRFSGQTFTRDREWMRRYDDSDHLLLQLFASGQNRVVNGTQEYVEQPGNIYAVNLAHQVKAESTAARVMSLVLPRDLLLSELPHLADVCGAVFVPDSAGARIFVDHMMSLADRLPRATAEETPALVTSTLGLLESLTVREDVESSAALHATFRSACGYIDRHLTAPELSVGSICNYLRCSRATLYRLFKSQGGVYEHIQRRKLAACFREVSAPRNRHRRIFDIALDFGFTSPSHFSHLFRSHFGMTPREAREAGLDIASALPPVMPGGSGEEAVERACLWAKTLTGQIGPR